VPFDNTPTQAATLKSSAELAREDLAAKFSRWFGGSVESHLADLNAIAGRSRPGIERAAHSAFRGA
jgi:hypothetical protein